MMMIFFTAFKIRHLLKKIKPLQHYRLQNQPSASALQKERTLYLKLADLYRRLQGKKKHPFARERMLESYRAGALMEDAEAGYLLAKSLLDEARFRQGLQTEELFASPSNERRMTQLYDEALAYLKAGAELNHIQARRLLGLCYIEGWGVAPDQEKGFNDVVASIEAENSWSKVPQIFAAMGLNKPEFFALIMKRRKVS